MPKIDLRTIQKKAKQFYIDLPHGVSLPSNMRTAAQSAAKFYKELSKLIPGWWKITLV